MATRRLAGDVDRGRGVATDGGVSNAADNVDYWAAQVRAFLDRRDYEEVSVTERYNADDVVLTLPTDSDLRRRRNREVLVTELETAGFDLLTTGEQLIYVDATDDRLDPDHHDWLEAVDGDDEPNAMADGDGPVPDDPQDAIFEALDRHEDGDESAGAPVGAVVETVLRETDHGLADIGTALRDLSVTGGIYQPAATTIRRASGTAIGAPTYEFRVRENSFSYGPWDADGGEWALSASTADGDRVRLLLGETAMYDLWTEVQHVPWPREPEPRGTLSREIVEKVNGMDEDQLREVLDTVDAVGGER